MRKRVYLSPDLKDPRHIRFLQIMAGQKYKTEFIVNAVLAVTDGNQLATTYIPPVQLPETGPAPADAPELIDEEIMDMLEEW